jgi:hypothetical protein
MMGATLLAADGDADLAIMKRIENRQVTLAGDAERVLHPLPNELIDQNFATRADVVLGTHHDFSPHPAADTQA